MSKDQSTPGAGQILTTSLVVLVIFIFLASLLTRTVEPIPPRQETERISRSLEMFAVVLGLLAGGCMAGYFTFDYSKIYHRDRHAALFISWIFIASIILLTFLVMYTLRKSGAFEPMDRWAILLLMTATYAFVDGLMIYEQWKMRQFKPDKTG